MEQVKALLEATTEGAFLMKDTFVACNIWKTQKDQIIGRSPADFAPEFQPNGERSQDGPWPL
ncbi:MAG: hypothetical protein CSA29_02920 [Desulfobacterales bacterium]|nr:MAG: hypothetical protein CSA29_02920 [Desulfobacterales bacterium]